MPREVAIGTVRFGTATAVRLCEGPAVLRSPGPGRARLRTQEALSSAAARRGSRSGHGPELARLRLASSSASPVVIAALVAAGPASNPAGRIAIGPPSAGTREARPAETARTGPAV